MAGQSCAAGTRVRTARGVDRRCLAGSPGKPSLQNLGLALMMRSGTATDVRQGGRAVEQPSRTSPPAAKGPTPAGFVQSMDRGPVPTPPRKPLTAALVLPSRGLERERQQLIYDLAMLAASRLPSA